MADNIKDEVVVITGASSGLGEAVLTLVASMVRMLGRVAVQPVVPAPARA